MSDLHAAFYIAAILSQALVVSVYFPTRVIDATGLGLREPGETQAGDS